MEHAVIFVLWKRSCQQCYLLSKFFIHQLMHNWIVLQNNFKIYIKIGIKTAPTCSGAVAPSSVSELLVLAKVTVVNTLRTGSFKLFKRPLPGFLTILTL